MRIHTFLNSAVLTISSYFKRVGAATLKALRWMSQRAHRNRGDSDAYLLDQLEARLLMANVNILWTDGAGAGNHDWTNNNNWSVGGVPDRPDDRAGNAYFVTIAANAVIDLDANINVTRIEVDNGAVVTIERHDKSLGTAVLKVGGGAKLTINNGQGSVFNADIIEVASEANETGELVFSADNDFWTNHVTAAFIDVGTGAGSVGKLTVGSDALVDASATGPVTFGGGGTARVTVDGGTLYAKHLILASGGLGQGVGAANLTASSLTVEDDGIVVVYGADGFDAGDDAHGPVGLVIAGGRLSAATTKTATHGITVDVEESGTFLTGDLTLKADTNILVESALLHSTSTTFDGGDALDVIYSSGIWWDDAIDGPIGAAIEGDGTIAASELNDTDDGGTYLVSTTTTISPGDSEVITSDEDGNPELAANGDAEDPFGIMTIDGDFDASSGDMTLDSIIGTDGQSNCLAVTGTATIGGGDGFDNSLAGIFHVFLAPGTNLTDDYAPGDTWTLMTASTINDYLNLPWSFSGSYLGLDPNSNWHLDVRQVLNPSLVDPDPDDPGSYVNGLVLTDLDMYNHNTFTGNIDVPDYNDTDNDQYAAYLFNLGAPVDGVGPASTFVADLTSPQVHNSTVNTKFQLVAGLSIGDLTVGDHWTFIASPYVTSPYYSQIIVPNAGSWDQPFSGTLIGLDGTTSWKFSLVDDEETGCQVVLTYLGTPYQVLDAGDDNSSSLVDLGFTINFNGLSASQVYVNNNGNITFGDTNGGPKWEYTPDTSMADLNFAMIAPFWADVDTGYSGMGTVSYGQETWWDADNGVSHPSFAVHWAAVDYYGSSLDPRFNTFDLYINQVGDSGDFDIVFSYGAMNWETGYASGGTDGLGGYPARIGYTNGDGTYYEDSNSATTGGYLALANQTFVYQIRNE